MPNRASYLEFLLEQLAPLGDVTTRSMFGLKADDHNRPAFEARGLEAFHPFEDANAVMQYYEAPPEMFEDPKALLDWAGGAVAAGRRAKAKKKPRKKPKKALKRA
jgi:DNA transformation protein